MFWALSEVAAHPGKRIGDLADRLRIHPSTASNLCNRLRQSGLIVAKPSPDDGRAMCLHPTRKSVAVLKRRSLPHRGLLVEAMSKLSSQQCEKLADALAPLSSALAIREAGS
jgi:DNA-binding MarR family transcriptional regulator